ncbi:hypothetical protein COF68_05325 [Bacillus toyonensis]|uniref:hypothetical protein n=1 Tax=Bacillus toyonensis TaxID=155322 RepID=UPI000BFC7F90|nr:hypothetical protein [Bacillus toyonensis]PHE64264.1 hypothetical protein COF68_05325 [Bacillus toyonensis]
MLAEESTWICDLESDEQERKALQTLTEMETKVWNHLVTEGWYAEMCFSDVVASEVAEATEIPTRQLRGVLSSLEKKDLIRIIKQEYPEPFIHRELDFRN